MTPEQLVEDILRLVEQGVHNVNFVTPDHFLPHVIEVCHQLRASGVTVPFLYNCSGYMHAERVPELAEVIDIFLPDFKFAEPLLAQRCLGDPRYPKLALAALEAMVDCVGFLSPWDDSGETLATRGVLVRHLVLPGHAENSLATLDLLHERFGTDLPLSVMSQYGPTPQCVGEDEFARTVSSDEYERVCDRVMELGFEHMFIQPEFGDDNFFPDFDQEEPFAGNRPS
jgi:putative pyruvate formate lyase activating enzyme